MSEEKYLCPQCGTMNNELRAELARRDERIAELEAMITPHSFMKYLVKQLRDPELADNYVKACIRDATYKGISEKQKEIISRLKEDAERLLYFAQHIPSGSEICRASIADSGMCICGLKHAITLHRALMKELEEK